MLADGVPLNDAFGGWVYWDKLPQVAIDRIEVLRGSGSDLYGADAVGGVVQMLTWHPSQPAARALVEGGGMGTGRISMFGGGRSRPLELHGRRRVVHAPTATFPWPQEQDPGIAPRGPDRCQDRLEAPIRRWRRSSISRRTAGAFNAARQCVYRQSPERHSRRHQRHGVTAGHE